jgi:hypothetical protein
MGLCRLRQCGLGNPVRAPAWGHALGRSVYGMSALVEVRMPRYPECWETCGNCGQGEVVVLEVLVQPGDIVAADDNLVTLETGKVALDIPSPRAGRVAEILVREGDAVAQDALILTLEVP